ncbi:chemotaxis protein CheW [Chitinivorax sp. PXF-14]|uniref:chemotaxis protein CheW n=1 Tax=Chitinivorax sp. PXF-14 TaxID=3230488 RepID=UPI003466EB49
MSFDLSQFHQVFFDEAAEHLDTMEQLLVAIDINDPTADELDSIFRAAHSIKGGAATFGFHDLTEVTHLLENHLDLLRQGKAPLTVPVVDVFLQAVDGLRHMLAEHRRGGTSDEAQIAELCLQLSALRPSAPARAEPDTSPVSARREGERVFRATLDSVDEVVFHILRDDWATRGELLRAELIQRQATIEISTAVERAELYETLELLLPPRFIGLEDITRDVAGQPAVEEDDGFGLFVDSPGSQIDAWSAGGADLLEEDGFGLFLDGPGIAQDAQAWVEEDGFGLFVEPAAAGTFHEEDGFGLFHPPVAAAPVPAVAATAAPAASVPAKPAAQPGAAARPGSKAGSGDSSIRVSTEKVDQLIDLVGELVITQAMLAQTAEDEQTVSDPMQAALTQLERNLRDLQEAVMSIRMLPMSSVFSRFPRMVRDVAGRMNKAVDLKLIGEHTELDKGLIEQIADPLTHLVRNSIDHGIETQEQRLASGKPAKGQITLEAMHQGGSVVISVSDDGQGLRRDKILEKARERGLAVSDGMSDSDVWQLIFAPGFSTADQVTDISGRGVGMDVVKRNVDDMGGRIDVSSTPGYGARMTIRLPLTLAIVDGMSVAVGGDVYILPISFIVESLQPRTEDIYSISGKGLVLNVRNEYLPLVPLHRILGLTAGPDQAGEPLTGESLAIVVEADSGKVALQVDALLGQHQVVIKNLETNYRRVPGLSGATILGDGRVAMILDVTALVRLTQE